MTSALYSRVVYLTALATNHSGVCKLKHKCFCSIEVSRLKQELKLQANNQFILRRRHSDNLVDVEKLRKVYVGFI